MGYLNARALFVSESLIFKGAALGGGGAKSRVWCTFRASDQRGGRFASEFVLESRFWRKLGFVWVVRPDSLFVVWFRVS